METFPTIIKCSKSPGKEKHWGKNKERSRRNREKKVNVERAVLF